MDENRLDLEMLTVLLTDLLTRVERLTAAEVTALVHDSNLEDAVLKSLGMDRMRLSPEEQERFSVILRAVFGAARG